MNTPKLVKINGSNTEGSMGLFREFEDLLDAIRERAYSLFEARGRGCGGSGDDWLRAERELFEVPVHELTETESVYEWGISAPGFTPEQLNVGVAPYWVTVLGQPNGRTDGDTGVDRKQLFCRLELGTPVEVDQVDISFDNGALLVRMPKVGPSREVKRSQQAKVEHPSTQAA